MDVVKETERRDLAAEPLLGDNCSEEEYTKPAHRLHWIWLLHGAIVVTYSVFLSGVFLLNVDRSTSCDKGRQSQSYLPCPSLISSLLKLNPNLTVAVPSREGLQWEDRRFETNIVDNPFAGPPREELENAWHDLLKSMSG